MGKRVSSKEYAAEIGRSVSFARTSLEKMVAAGLARKIYGSRENELKYRRCVHGPIPPINYVEYEIF